ncbi:MAG: acylneuraminate cytidylyltransferase family protein [Sphaerochaetaceae bacterium]|nr:acylneuraminate cytidylyltransferase family protein [Sphaerochaetaceae bacterium]
MWIWEGDFVCKSKVVAIITARGGSKGLPRKNVLDLAGKPLIVYTISAALQSKVFDKVVVSTDDKEIRDVSLSLGVEVINRPSELATDTASSLDVIEHALLKLKKSEEGYTHFMLLQPTSPLRKAEHIEEAWEKYLDENAVSLVSVTEVEHPPQKMLVETSGGVEPLTKWEELTKPRQSLPKAYLPNGAVYICKVEEFLKTKNIFEKPLKILKMDKKSSIDIDSMNDLKQVERILNEKI